jgi:regulator of sigma E protease
MQWILAVFAIIVSLLLVVGVHELGHAIVARCCGVTIQGIAIGFGKPLMHWHDRKGREWLWGLWPIGGYVDLLNSRIHPVLPSQKNYCFDKKPVWRRILILLAGSGANFLAAWLVLTLYFLIGYQQTSPVIAAVRPNSIVATAHLAPGDKFIKIAHQPTKSWQAVGMQLVMNLGKNHVPVTVKKTNGVLHQTHLDLKGWNDRYHTYSLLAQIGLIPDNAKSHKHSIRGLSLVPAMQQAWKTTLGLAHFYLVLLKQILTKTIPFFLLLGPIGIFSNIIDSFVHGFAVFLFFIAQFNLVVAVFNLLPIPTLDGGSIVYAIVEQIRGKPMSVALEVLIYRLMLIGFVIVLVQLILNDVQRYFG